MAIQNHPGLYQAGNVKFDATPTVNLYAQLMQRKQAKEEALDEYDRQRLTNINDKGVRDRDREGFDNRINNIRTYYNQNKDKIRKAGTAEAYEYEKMFRDVSSYVNQSKERTAKQDAAINFYQEKLKQDGVVPDDYMTDLEINDRGIDEQGSQSFDLKKWLSMPKPYDREKSNKPYNSIKRVPGQPFTEPISGNKLRVNEVVEEKFDKAGLEQIQFMAANDFENSYSFREEVKKEFSDPVKRVEMAKTFKQINGVDPASMDDYAFAYKMQELQPVVRKVKQIDNKEAVMDKAANIALSRQKIMEAIKQGNRKELVGIRRAFQVADQVRQDEILDDVIVGYKENPNAIPEDIKDEFKKRNDKGHSVDFNEVKFSPDGTKVQFLYKDEKGNVMPEFSAEATVSDIKERTRKKIETAQTDVTATPKTNPTTGKKETIAEKMRRLKGQK